MSKGSNLDKEREEAKLLHSVGLTTVSFTSEGKNA